MQRVRGLLHRAVVPALAMVTAFILGAIVIVLTDFDNLARIGADPFDALGTAIARVSDGYGAMLAGAIGDPGHALAALQQGDTREFARAIRPFTEALLGATPLIFASLAVTLSFRAGLFNFGLDGQFAIGGMGSAITAVVLGGHLPPFLVLIAALLGGAVFGAAYGFIPGALKARTGAHEVITTLMLNVVAAQIVLYVGRGGFFSRGTVLPKVPLLFDLPTVRLDWGFIVALAMTGVVSFLLFRTTLGFELRANGLSPTVARGAGMRPGLAMIAAMSLSGAIAGLASALGELGPGGAGAVGGLGFVALALALLGGLRPGAVLLAALLYGALNNGAKTMVIETGIPLALLTVVIALAMMFVAAPGLVRRIWRLPAANSDAESVAVLPPSSPDALAGL
jgi:ABC-type uncharacterized transport system permease subunit